MNIYKFTKYLQIASKDTKLSIWGDSTISVERPSSIRKRNATLVTSSWALFPNTKNSLKVYGVHGLLTQHSRICETVTWTEKRNRICLNQVRREHFSESYQPPLLKVGDSGAWRVTVFSVLILQAGFHPCGSSHLFSWWCDNKGWQHQPTNKGSKISVCARVHVCCVHMWMFWTLVYGVIKNTPVEKTLRWAVWTQSWQTDPRDTHPCGRWVSALNKNHTYILNSCHAIREEKG